MPTRRKRVSFTRHPSCAQHVRVRAKGVIVVTDRYRSCVQRRRHSFLQRKTTRTRATEMLWFTTIHRRPLTQSSRTRACRHATSASGRTRRNSFSSKRFPDRFPQRPQEVAPRGWPPQRPQEAGPKRLPPPSEPSSDVCSAFKLKHNMEL